MVGINSKKGFAFSLIAVILVVLFGTVISSFLSESQFETEFSFESKVESLNSYYELVKENYLEILLEISGRAALETISEVVKEEQIFINESDLEKVFIDLLIYGNFSYGSIDYPGAGIFPSMVNKTLPHLVEKLENDSREHVFYSDGFNVGVVEDNFEVLQDSPWTVRFQIQFDLNYSSDEFNISNYKEFVYSDVSIVGVLDPLVGYYGNVSKPINYSEDYSSIYSLNNTWDLDALNDSLMEQNFVQSDRGMSYLMRLTNSSNSSFSSPSSRIESFILPYHLSNFSSYYSSDLQITNHSRSFVDYLYFRDDYSICTVSDVSEELLYKINNISRGDFSDFRLDLNSTIFYLGNDWDSDNYDVVCSDFTP